MPALTVYTTGTNTNTVGLGRALTTVAPNAAVNPTVTVSNSTGRGLLPSRGTTSGWPSVSTDPDPDGTGYVLDAATLDNMAISAGSWSGQATLLTSAQNLTGVVTMRAWRWSPDGSYTLIASSSVASRQYNTTATTVSFPAAVGIETEFSSGDRLYIDYVVNITASQGGNKTLTFRQNIGATSSVVTPGYAPLIKHVNGQGRPLSLSLALGLGGGGRSRPAIAVVSPVAPAGLGRGDIWFATPEDVITSANVLLGGEFVPGIPRVWDGTKWVTGTSRLWVEDGWVPPQSTGEDPVEPATVTGPITHLTLSTPPGTVTAETATPTTVTGVATTLSLATPPGTVTAGTIIPASVAGPISALTLGSLAGTVVGGTVVLAVVSAPPSVLGLATPGGTVEAGTVISASISGPPTQFTVASAAGTVTAGTVIPATVSGPVSALTLAAPAGSVAAGTAIPAAVAGPVTGLTLAAPAGAVIAETVAPAAVAGPPSEITLSTPVGMVFGEIAHAGGPFTDLNLNGNRVSGLGKPGAPTDLVTKAYVDARLPLLAVTPTEPAGLSDGSTWFATGPDGSVQGTYVQRDGRLIPGTVKVWTGVGWATGPVRVRGVDGWTPPRPDAILHERIFTTQVPASLDTDDDFRYTLGTAWDTSTPGVVEAVYYYKGGPAFDGVDIPVGLFTHFDSSAPLGTGSRVQLASDPVGWIRVPLATPVYVQVGIEYIAAYVSGALRGYVSTEFFHRDYLVNGSLRAIADNNYAPTGIYNGLFSAGSTLARPTDNYHQTCYFVDIDFVSDEASIDAFTHTYTNTY